MLTSGDDIKSRQASLVDSRVYPNSRGTNCIRTTYEHSQRPAPLCIESNRRPYHRQTCCCDLGTQALLSGKTVGMGPEVIVAMEMGTTELRRMETNLQTRQGRPALLVYVPVDVQTLDYVLSLVLVTVPAPFPQLRQLIPDNNTKALHSFSKRTRTTAQRLFMAMKVVIVSVT